MFACISTCIQALLHIQALHSIYVTCAEANISASVLVWLSAHKQNGCGKQPQLPITHVWAENLQLGFLTIAYPSLVITYLGQAAYLMVNPDNYATTFYSCIPGPVYWPVFVVAVLAAIVASQVSLCLIHY